MAKATRAKSALAPSLSVDARSVKEIYASTAWKEESMEAVELGDSASSLRRMAASRSEESMEEKELGDALADLQDRVCVLKGDGARLTHINGRVVEKTLEGGSRAHIQLGETIQRSRAFYPREFD